MAMTMTQKILAKHAGLDHVEAGQLIEAKLDVVMANDITGPMALPIFDKMADKVFDKNKVVLVPDHFTPNKDIKSAENSKAILDFTNKQCLTHRMEQGKCGVEHAILPEKGIVVAGECIIGADSHTCTYGALGAFSTGVGTTDIATGMATGELWFKVPSAIKFVITGKPSEYVSGKDVILHIIDKIGVDGALYKSMEFVGDGIQYLTMDDRFTICNMAIEAGAKNGIFPVDDQTIAYIEKHSKKPYEVFEADEDAEYEQVVENATTKTLLFADRFPFRYLLDDYDLNYYAAFPGCSADVEASFYTITFLANKIDQLDLKSIFVIDQTNLKIAQTVKDNTKKKNQKIMYLDSLQSVDDQKIKDGYSYLKAMKYNLKVLKKAL